MLGLALQLSAASVINFTSGKGTSPIHCTLTFAAAVAVGLTSSLTIINCFTSTTFPQSSSTLYVLVIVSGQVWLSDTSPTCVTTGAAVQLSFTFETALIFAGGTWLAHWTVTSAGAVAVGGIKSLITMVCIHVLT